MASLAPSSRAVSADQIAGALLAFPPDTVADDPLDPTAYEKAIKAHFVRILRLFKDAAGELAVHAVPLLDCLDPAVHSLSYLALLEALFPADEQLQNLDPNLVDKIVAFLVAFDPRQIRYMGISFSNLFTLVASGQIIPPSIAVDVLTKALLKIDPTGSMLTSNHVALARLAYNTDNIAAALPVVGKNVVYYPGMANVRDPVLLSDPALPPPSYISKDTGLTQNLKAWQVLEYDYVVGLMHCAVRDWAAARAAFARAASFPTRDAGVSKIMVEAHKKWVLTGLLLEGRSEASPQHTSAAAARSFNVMSKPYLQVADCFDRHDAEALRTEAEVSWPTFTRDQNEGLVREVLAAHQKWQIAHLRGVYTKLSIAEIRAQTKSAETGASLASDAEVEALVGEMIASGMLRARIHHPPEDVSGEEPSRPAHLEFLPAADELSEAECAAQIADAARTLSELQPILRATRERLANSRDFARHLLKEQKREREGNRGGGGGGGDAAEYGTDPAEDEDLMTGVLSSGY